MLVVLAHLSSPSMTADTRAALGVISASLLVRLALGRIGRTTLPTQAPLTATAVSVKATSSAAKAAIAQVATVTVQVRAALAFAAPAPAIGGDIVTAGYYVVAVILSKDSVFVDKVHHVSLDGCNRSKRGNSDITAHECSQVGVVCSNWAKYSRCYLSDGCSQSKERTNTH